MSPEGTIHWMNVTALLPEDWEQDHHTIAERASLLVTEAGRLAGCEITHEHLAVVETESQAEEILAVLAAAFAEALATMGGVLTHEQYENATRFGGHVGAELRRAVQKVAS